MILRTVGLLSICWFVYDYFFNVWTAYHHHKTLLEENRWLYDHCIQNHRLRDHTDACDKVLHLFATSPLETVFSLSQVKDKMEDLYQHAGVWHDAASGFVARHKYWFLVIWLIAFLLLPSLLCVSLGKKGRLFLPSKRRRDNDGILSSSSSSSYEYDRTPHLLNRYRRNGCTVV